MVHILNVHLTHLQCNAMTSATVSKYGVMVTCPENIPDTLKALKVARTTVKEILQQAKEKRKAHNQKVAEMHAFSGNVTAGHALKAIINAENMSSMWQKIKFADKGSQDNNIMLIQIPASWPDANMDISLQM
eukprot:2853738-Ditylum_brightwellii.AAC.1